MKHLSVEPNVVGCSHTSRAFFVLSKGGISSSLYWHFSGVAKFRLVLEWAMTGSTIPEVFIIICQFITLSICYLSPMSDDLLVVFCIEYHEVVHSQNLHVVEQG